MRHFSIVAAIVGFLAWLFFKRERKLSEVIAENKMLGASKKLADNEEKLSKQKAKVDKSQEAFDEAYSNYLKHRASSRRKRRGSKPPGKSETL